MNNSLDNIKVVAVITQTILTLDTLNEWDLRLSRDVYTHAK